MANVVSLGSFTGGGNLIYTKSPLTLLNNNDVNIGAAGSDGKGTIVAFKQTVGSVVGQYSKDGGIPWNSCSGLGNSSLFEWVCYGKNIFVAKSQFSGTNGGFYSYDGINWTSANFPEDFGSSCCCYGQGKFVAVESFGRRTCYSTDGINWTLGENINVDYLQGIAYGNGLFVATRGYNTSSDSVYTSVDGINDWAIIPLPVAKRWGTIVFGKDKFVIAPSMLLGTTNSVVYSSNGSAWYSSTLPKTAQWEAMAYGNGIYVIVAMNTGDVAVSYDGVNWVSSNLPYEAKVFGGTNRPFIHDGKKFMLFSHDTEYKVFYSVDGISWEVEYAQLSLPDGTNVTKNIANTINVM